MNKKKLVLIALFINIILLIGVSYAFFNYDKVSSKSHSVITGDINLTYNEEQDTLSLTSAFPETDEQARSRDDNYITFSISGKNESNKNIYYEIDLTYGDEISGRTRIKDEGLIFDLIEIGSNNEETYLLKAIRYDDLSNKRIYVNMVPSGTNNTISKTYKLRMWISDGITISDTLDDADYTTTQFKNLFASVKVRVQGDFSVKTMDVDPSCFMTNSTIGYELNHNMTQEELNYCINFIHNMGWIDEGSDTAESYCQGNEMSDGELLQNFIDSNGFTYYQLEDLENNNVIKSVTYLEISDYDDSCDKNLVIPSQIDGNPVTAIGFNAFHSKGLLSVVIPDTITEIRGTDDFQGAFSYNRLRYVEIPNGINYLSYGIFSNNELTNVSIPSNITRIEQNAFINNKISNIELSNNIETIRSAAFSTNQISSVNIPSSVKILGGFEYNQLTSITIPNSVEVLESFAFSFNKLSSVIIPEGVKTIQNDAFSNNQLSSVTISNTVTDIKNNAFSHNKLSSVTIPDSVTLIGVAAFTDNKLINVTIGNGITSIGYGAFTKNQTSNPNLTSINIDKSCDDVKYNLKYSWGGMKNYYPWLNRSTPYKGAYSHGTTIYGSGGTVCEAF